MPIYEYQCLKCGRIVEVFQTIEGLTPECHDQPMKKLISKGSFILKGKGWYATDYKDKPKKTETPS